MKPIKLEIEGINSYLNRQTIDFEKLTSRGIFGIFGKTGSGKSTILDAITLALYGNIARGTKEFINSNCEKAYVDYEFEIGQGKDRNVYRVSRAFKRTVRGDRISSTSSYVRLARKNELGEYDVLADKVGDVNSEIKSVIGLEESDFLKSVVLPQGKFSEFLTLSGKDRRNMLERIFNLEEYGSILNMRLSSEKKAVDERLNILEARLSEYPNVSEESRIKLEEENRKLLDESGEIEKNLKKQTDIYDEKAKIYELQLERDSDMEKLEKLEKNEGEINSFRESVDCLKKAEKIIPDIKRYDSLVEDIENLNEFLKKTGKELEELREQREKKIIRFKETEKNRSFIPDLSYRIKDIERLEKTVESIDKAGDELEKAVKDSENRTSSIRKLKSNIKKIEALLESQKAALKETEDAVKRNKVDNDRKETVLKAISIEKDIKKQCSLKMKETEKLEAEYKSVDSMTESLIRYGKEKINAVKKTEKAKKMLDIETERKTLSDEEYEKYMLIKEELSRNAKEAGNIIKKMDEISDRKKDIIENISKLNLNIVLSEKRIEEIDKKIKKIKEDEKNRKVEFHANKVKEYLISHHDECRCPVCGGKFNISSIEMKSINDAFENSELDSLENRLQNEKTLKIEYQTKLDYENRILLELSQNYIQFENMVVELLDVGHYKNLPIMKNWKISDMMKKGELLEEFIENGKRLAAYLKECKENKDNKTRSIEAYKKEIQNCEKEEIEIDKIILELESKKSYRNENTIMFRNNIKDIEKSIEESKKNLEDMERELGLDKGCADEEYRKIKAMEELTERNVKERDRLSAEIEKTDADIDKNREILKKEEISLSILKSDIENLKKEKTKLNKDAENLVENIDFDWIFEKIFSGYTEISKPLWTRELKAFASSFKWNLKRDEGRDGTGKIIKAIENFTKKVESGYNREKTELENLESDINSKDSKMKSRKTELDLKGELESSTLSVIENLMKTLGFRDMDEVRNVYGRICKLDEMEKRISQFEEDRKELKSVIKSIDKKLGGRSVDKEEMDVEKRKLEEIKAKSDENKRNLTKSQYMLDEMIRNLSLVSNILEKKKEETLNMDNVLQLEKVLKGNRFVEYLSQMYLKNIVIDASKRLGDITNGRYSLEIDSGYMFVIRDNANGGIRRSADTLSGGETFLTSLALALALSSQIQLKGSAPLEFFFLDEGFGTLDSELLDTVMCSLEKLHSDSMSVGIISHVEELKNRIPMKLIVDMDDATSSSVARIELT